MRFNFPWSLLYKSELTPLAKPLVVFRVKLWSKCRVAPSGLPSTLCHMDSVTHWPKGVGVYVGHFEAAYLAMMKALRVQGWILLPALTGQGAWIPRDGTFVMLWMSQLMLTMLHSPLSPPMFTSITTSPKCRFPSFVTERFTYTCGQTSLLVQLSQSLLVL